MTDDKVDKTLEQQENFEEVARSKDIEVQCYASSNKVFDNPLLAVVKFRSLYCRGLKTDFTHLSFVHLLLF